VNFGTRRVLVRPWVMVLLSAAACSGDDSGWKGGLQMTVNWSHYTDATPTCRRIEAEWTGKNPSSVESGDNCFRVEGTHCYVLTSDKTDEERFGQLVRGCFNVLQYRNDRER
jgi:hypothetical protein